MVPKSRRNLEVLSALYCNHVRHRILPTKGYRRVGRKSGSWTKQILASHFHESNRLHFLTQSLSLVPIESEIENQSFFYQKSVFIFHFLCLFQLFLNSSVLSTAWGPKLLFHCWHVAVIPLLNHSLSQTQPTVTNSALNRFYFESHPFFRFDSSNKSCFSSLLKANIESLTYSGQ